MSVVILTSHEADTTDSVAIAGAPLVTIGMFIFGWTLFPHVHWIAPIIGSVLFGTG
jgi:hypothetical protein